MARNIIVFVADGLRPGSINPIDTPTLYSIRQSGVDFTNSHSLFPTFTTPNASAIATGHYLGDTGDFSNTVYTGYPVINANGSVTPFIENDPILADINANSNQADPDTSFSKNNFLTEESLLAYARLNSYSTAAIGKIGPVAIQDVTQDTRAGGTATPNIVPKTVIIDDSTYINTLANATNPPLNSVGSQNAIPLSPAIASDLSNAGLIGQNIPGTTTPETTVGSIRNNQPAGNLTTAGTLNSNVQQQQFFADATTKAVLPQFVSDIASNSSKGFAAVYWSRDPDGTQHNNGDAFNAADPGNNSLTIGINGPTSKKGVADADANLKQIIDYLKATPDPANPGKTLYDNTDIFVTADHGFSTISKQAVGVTFDTAGNPTYTNTTSYAASLNYYTTDATTGAKTPTVHAGFLPSGFVAIDLAHDLGSTLYDPNKPTATVTTSNINNIQYTAVDPTKGELTTSGNGVIGGSGKVVNGVIDAGTQVVVAANGGSDLLYVPSNDPALVKQIVSFLAKKDYISGIFTDDKFGDVPGALKLSTIGLEGTAELPTPSIVINFKTFSTNPNDPNDPQAQVEVADTTLQQGQGMHGSFGRGDTFNNMLAIGPDFKSGYVDSAPVSNADVVPTLASILGWTLPSVGTLNGRVVSEALVNGPSSVASNSSTLTSTSVDGKSTILNFQNVGNVPYFDAAGFAGGTDGLKVPGLPVLSVGATTATTAELSGTPGVFHVATSVNNSAPLTFNYIIGGTATNGVDYSKLTGTATIKPGEFSVDIPVTPIDDALAEGNESVTLTLASGASFSIDATKSAASITVIDNEPTPVGTSKDDFLIATPSTKFDGQSNIVFTGAGKDEVDLAISPTSSNNRIDTGSGADTIYVSQGDRVFGGAGDDVFDATDGKGNNRMSGGAGNDTFFLGTNDHVLGGDGNDKFFVGSGGNNLLSGGAGADQFWIVDAELPSASNTILDFQIGTDVIGIQGAVSLGISASNLVLTQIGADTSISAGGQTLAILKGIQSSSLAPTNANQFIFA
jgi:arylsulfatase A-like enzyme